MTDWALQIHTLHKAYGSKAVLRNVNLQVPSGEYFGLVGVNGAGKTTLIKSILDFIVVDAGDIEIFSTPQRDAAARNALAYLPERFNPPFFATGADFLDMMCDLHGVAYTASGAGSLFVRFGLDHAALHKPVSTYSKGMVQKLGLIACLLVERKLLLFDEPMTGLDPMARAMVKRELLERRARGQTLFFSTHLLADVEALCDRIAVLHDGAVKFVGSCSALCEHYNSDDIEQAYLACVGAP